MKEPGYIERFRLYANGSASPDQLDATEKELFEASDRTVVIVLTSFLESALAKYISAHLRTDLTSSDRKAVLGTFSEKIALAYAMQLIGPETRRDLDAIRHMRNGFAHAERPLSFEDAPTIEFCAKLLIPDRDDRVHPVRGFTKAAEPNWHEFADMTVAQNRFRSTVHTIAAKMMSVRHMKEAGIEWPKPLSETFP